MSFDFSTSSKSILQRKGSQDLPASEYYAIYKKHSQPQEECQLNLTENLTSFPTETERNPFPPPETGKVSFDNSMDDPSSPATPTAKSAEVKVQGGGGIAQR